MRYWEFTLTLLRQSAAVNDVHEVTVYCFDEVPHIFTLDICHIFAERVPALNFAIYLAASGTNNICGS
jgi:hypothetical protein